MDEYYISKEDWDTIIELGVDEKKDDTIMKKISTATKTALTRKWVYHLSAKLNPMTKLCFDKGTMHLSILYRSTKHKI